MANVNIKKKKKINKYGRKEEKKQQIYVCAEKNTVLGILSPYLTGYYN